MATIAEIGAVLSGAVGGFEAGREQRLAERRMKMAAQDRHLQNQFRTMGLNLSIEEAKDARNRETFNFLSDIVQQFRDREEAAATVVREEQEATQKHDRAILLAQEKARLGQETAKFKAELKEPEDPKEPKKPFTPVQKETWINRRAEQLSKIRDPLIPALTQADLDRARDEFRERFEAPSPSVDSPVGMDNTPVLPGVTVTPGTAGKITTQNDPEFNSLAELQAFLETQLTMSPEQKQTILNNARARGLR